MTSDMMSINISDINQQYNVIKAISSLNVLYFYHFFFNLAYKIGNR
jgi:hypothetical protein